MKLLTEASCRCVRREVQNALDRFDASLSGDERILTASLPQAVRMHLESCGECRRYVRSLITLRRELGDRLDRELSEIPPPDLNTLLHEADSGGDAVRERGWVGRASVRGFARVFASLRRWLLAPASGPALALRRTAVCLAGIVLVSAAGLRIHTVYRTHQIIRRQIDSVVERIYSEPLMPGIESALLHTRPSFSDYMEETSRAVDAWLEDVESYSHLN